MVRRQNLNEEQTVQIQPWSQFSKGQFDACGTLSVTILGKIRRLPRNGEGLIGTCLTREGEEAAASVTAVQTIKRKQEEDDMQAVSSFQLMSNNKKFENIICTMNDKLNLRN